MAAHNYANTSVEMVVYDDPLHVSERVAVAAFLAGYSGGTRTSYTTDLRIFTGWCHEHRLNLFSVKRAHLELSGRWMEQEGRMASTIARRLSTLVVVLQVLPDRRHHRQEPRRQYSPAQSQRRVSNSGLGSQRTRSVVGAGWFG